MRIGKIETSDEYGGAKAKFRKAKGKNEYLLDLVLPRGPQGFQGFDATINGKSSIEILAGNNIEVTQQGKKVFINSLVNPFELVVVNELPTENISSSAMYFVPSSNPEEENIYDEYIYMNFGTEDSPNFDWEHLGSTKVDLSGYVKNTDYATSSKAGVVKTNSNYGTAMNGDTIVINAATNSMIDSKDNGRCPIVPSRINYMFEKQMPTLTQDEYDELVKNGTVDENLIYQIVEE